jgi:hypothetical protein
MPLDLMAAAFPLVTQVFRSPRFAENLGSYFVGGQAPNTEARHVILWAVPVSVFSSRRAVLHWRKPKFETLALADSRF